MSEHSLWPHAGPQSRKLLTRRIDNFPTYWDTWLRVSAKQLPVIYPLILWSASFTVECQKILHLLQFVFREKVSLWPLTSPCFCQTTCEEKQKAKNITSNLNALILVEMPRFSGQWLELMETCLFETKSNFHINMMVGAHCILLATVMEFTQWSHCFPMHI